MLKKLTPENDDSPRPKDSGRWVTILFAVVVLTPSMVGFVMKFIEFIHTFQGDTGGAFAITPMVNYLLASMGFLCLLLWSMANGTFNDMELPKQIMLEREEQLDGGWNVEGDPKYGV